jgi:hypothetical protein
MYCKLNYVTYHSLRGFASFSFCLRHYKKKEKEEEKKRRKKKEREEKEKE